MTTTAPGPHGPPQPPADLGARPPDAAPEESLQRVWEQVRGRLRATLNPATYQLTFERMSAVGMTGERLTLAVETDFSRGWVMQRYLPLLKDALFEALGAEMDVAVVVRPGTRAENGAAPSASAPPTPALPEPAAPRVQGRLQARFTFESFGIGPSNRFAQAAALSVAEQPAKAYNPLFVYGGVGLGKTHLLHAIGHFVARTQPELSIHYVSTETFTNEWINALRDGRGQSFKDRYRSADVLLIDDIQSLQGRESTQDEFFHTFNALHERGKQIVICSDRPPKAIATLEDRLRSRFEQGLTTDIQPPDVETRIAILRKRVITDGYQVHDPEVLSFIASHIATNVRQLEGALIRVVAHSSINHRPITVDLAREVLQDLLASGEGVTIEGIQQEVCRYSGISMAELKGDRRTKRVVVPRQVAMYLARELTDASLPAIGRAFGGRDHTTVIYAVQKVQRQMADEGEVFSAVKTLTMRLKGHAG
jgi:chromosomal replication initiator protein